MRDGRERAGAVRSLLRLPREVGERLRRLRRLGLSEPVLIAPDLGLALAAHHDLLHRLVLVELDVVPVPEVVLAVLRASAELHPHRVLRGRRIRLGLGL